MTLFYELGVAEAAELWTRALGTLPRPELAFGPCWRDHPRPGERTWAVVGEDNAMLGLGSLSPWPEDPGVAGYCVCLLPEARGRGVHLVVREYLVEEAFRCGAREVRAAVLLSNTRHLDRRVAELRDGVWSWGGVHEDPPEAWFSITPRAWELRGSLAATGEKVYGAEPRQGPPPGRDPGDVRGSSTTPEVRVVGPGARGRVRVQDHEEPVDGTTDRGNGAPLDHGVAGSALQHAPVDGVNLLGRRCDGGEKDQSRDDRGTDDDVFHDLLHPLTWGISHRAEMTR